MDNHKNNNKNIDEQEYEELKDILKEIGYFD